MVVGILIFLIAVISKTYFSSKLNFTFQSLATLYFASFLYWHFLQTKCKFFLVCSLFFLYMEVYFLNLIGIQINKNIINVGSLIFGFLEWHYFIKEKEKIKRGFKELYRK